MDDKEDDQALAPTVQSISGTWRDVMTELRHRRELECDPADDDVIELHHEPCDGPPNCTCGPVTLSVWDDAGIEAALRAMDDVN